MWWITQILAIILITIAHIFNRWAGLNEISFYIRWGANIAIQIIAAPFFIISYTRAPTFFQPWFLGTSLIALLGFIVSFIFFGETIAILKILGAIMALVGAVLLIL